MNDLNQAIEHKIIVPNFDVFVNQLKEKACSKVSNNRTRLKQSYRTRGDKYVQN